MSEKEWREIPGYPGYKVTKDGKIMGTRGWERKLFPNPGGYFALRVWPMQETLMAHKAVLLAYCGPRPSPRHQSRHLNGNRQDGDVLDSGSLF